MSLCIDRTDTRTSSVMESYNPDLESLSSVEYCCQFDISLTLCSTPKHLNQLGEQSAGAHDCRCTAAQLIFPSPCSYKGHMRDDIIMIEPAVQRGAGGKGGGVSNDPGERASILENKAHPISHTPVRGARSTMGC